ncbi:hypothetical protein J1N35_033840 [Gossypium stocksii]|uniref:Uncharacterized protein n=1 Tax=Gossypium stocksii TaxID=47602 RepID=A0A9D3URF5_9ROSI|nr:hypothetical protein J1N35_033840 [Gossypium stocksii]
MTPKERVSRYTYLGIVIPPTGLKIRDHPSMVLQYPPSKKTSKFKTDWGIAISSSKYHYIDIVKGTKLDKKDSLCPSDPPITQGPCRGNFGNKILSAFSLKQPIFVEEERETH